MVQPHFVFTCLKLGPRILWSRLTWMRKYSKHPESAPIEVRFKKTQDLLRRCLKALRYDVKIHNLEYLNSHDGVFLGISNHRSFFDPVFYICSSEKPVSFVAKKEAFDIPFVSTVMKVIDAVSIDREDMLHQLQLFKSISERLKKNDLSYFIFVEGTRQKDPEPRTLPYKDGALKPAYWAEKDVIFSAIHGSELVTQKKPKGFKKRNITLEFHPVIKFNDIKDIPTTKVMPTIEKTTNETLVRIAQENKTRNLK